MEPYRRELSAHCYRLSGSLHEAEDLLQESMLKAWRGLPSFEGRSSLRTWLFKITTNVGIDALEKRRRRVLPMDLGPATPAAEMREPPRLDPIWIEPWPDEAAEIAAATPEAQYSQRESVALAFLVALQLLPPKQRAILLLRDVVGYRAAECADLLELSVAAVNSALQRARETVQRRAGSLADSAPSADDDVTAALLARYMAAWETADVDALVALLHDDATLAMPPLPEWLLGAQQIRASLAAMVLMPAMAGTFRMLPTRANGLPACALYHRSEPAGPFLPYSLHLIEIVDGRIAAMVAFLDGSLFRHFSLPAALEYGASESPPDG